MYHRCDDEPNVCYNGYHLMIPCKKLIYLQSLDFIIQVQLFEPPNIQMLTNCTTTSYAAVFSSIYLYRYQSAAHNLMSSIYNSIFVKKTKNII